MFAIDNLKEFCSSVVDYREYLKQSVLRDLKKQYKRSSLGYVWSMLQPLLMMITLTVAFSKLIGSRTENYSVFLFCGMLPWGYFSSTIMASLHSIKGNMRIISQVPVPKYLFVLTVAASNVVNFLLSLVPLVLVMLFVGHPVSVTALGLPLVFLPLILTSLGVSLLVSAMNVFFEDTEHLTTVVLRAVYFLCPILYAREHLPEWVIKWVTLNPMFGTIETMRSLVYEGHLPDPITYAANVGGGLVVLMIGLAIFRRSDSKFVYFV